MGPVYHMTNTPTGAIVVWLYGETNYFLAGFEACSIRGISQLVWKLGQKPVDSRAGEVLN